jgi:hypothetical protein
VYSQIVVSVSYHYKNPIKPADVDIIINSSNLEFSAGTSSTTKTGRHDIAEILLKVALKHQKSINYQL